MKFYVDIATLQDTRLADSGAMKGKDYTFSWQGKGSVEHIEYGVGFAVRNSLLSMIEQVSNGSERLLLTLRLNTSAGPVTLVSVYAPTIYATSDKKDEFYENFAGIISSVPNNEQLVVATSMTEWAQITTRGLGQFGVAKLNDVHLPRPMHRQLILSNEFPAQGFLETPALKELAPI